MPPRPQRALPARKRILANSFLNELGELMYEKEWKASYIKCLYADQRSRSADDLIGGEQSGAVSVHFAEAVASGIAMAEVFVSEVEISFLFRSDEKNSGELTQPRVVGFDDLFSDPHLVPEEPKDEKNSGELTHHSGAMDVDDSFLDSQPWPDEPQEPEEPRKIPAPGFYPIDRLYWNTRFDPDDIDWRKSQILVSAKFIAFGKENRGIDDDRVTTVPLYIANPRLALSKALAVPPLPAPALVEKYKRAQSYFWAEITAATWRLLAIQNPPKKRGLEADLIALLRQYMHDHGLQDHGTGRSTSPSTMKAVVGKIVKQWRNGDIRSRVPVSSSKDRARTAADKPIRQSE